MNLTPAPLVKTFAYSAIGNMLSKSDVGTYSYPAAGAPLPHAVMNVTGGSISSTFIYDANGNQTAGLGRSIKKSTLTPITLPARNGPFDLLTDRQGFPANEPGDEHFFRGCAISDSTKSVVAGKKWEKARARPLIEVVINEQAQLTPGHLPPIGSTLAGADAL